MKGGLARNTGWALAEFIVSVTVQFLVLRFVVTSAGVASVGIWAVLVSAAQVAGFLDFGLTGGISRFLAKAQFFEDRREIESVLAIVVYMSVPIYLAIATLIFGAMWYFLPSVMQPDLIGTARRVLPWSTSAWFFLILSITSGACLTALHFGYRKSQIAIAGLFIQAGLAWLWVPDHALIGLAGAQLVNYVLVIVAGLVSLRKLAGISLLGLFRFDPDRAKEVFRFSAGMQLPSMGWALFETSIRFLMSRFGGAVLTGQYEIAYRIAAQARVLFFYLAQPLGPALVAKGLEGKAMFRDFYTTVYARFSLFGVALAAGVIATAPIVSWIMLGQVSAEYLLFAVLTAAGSAAQVWAMPSENAAVSQGVIRFNAIGTFAAVGIMLVLGVAAGYWTGARGVALSVWLASATAAIVPLVANSRVLALPLRPQFRLAVPPRFFTRHKAG